MLLVSITALLGAGLDEDFEVPGEWEQAVSGLRADDFAKREKAAASLAALPLSALPWIEAQLKASSIGDDAEFLRRLSGVVKAITDRQLEVELENGLQVSIDLAAAKPEDLVELIDAVAPRHLMAANIRAIWEKPEPADFKYEGSYWGAVDKLFEVFPPQAALDPGREDLHSELGLDRFEEADLAATAQPRSSAGVLHVRVARTAIESSNGKDYFSVTLVPKVEPSYIADEVALLINGVHFGDGNSLVPEERVRSFKRQREEDTAQPGRTFNWVIPISGDIDISKPAGIEAVMQVKVRRMKWLECDLPEEDRGVSISDLVTMSVDERAEGSIKIRFEGPLGTRVNFNQHPQGGSKRLFDLLDKDGQVIEMRVQSSTNGSGGIGWRQSFTCKFQEGEAVSVRALLPGKLMTSRLPIDIDGIGLPGMGRAGGD